GGIDAAAEETGVSRELLGHRDGEDVAAARRLGQSKPDVLAFAAPSLRHAVLMGEARRLNIPCIGTGTLMETLALPTVVEDGEEGARRAVQLLIEHGHRRIGFVSSTFPLPWIFLRRCGFFAALELAGIEPYVARSLLIAKYLTYDSAEQLRLFLDLRRPKALVLPRW